MGEVGGNGGEEDCMAIVRGEWATCRVWIDDREVLPERSQRVRNHSPDGFRWGCGGSGPAQLALALLLELTNEDLALVWYQEVQWHLIARLPQADFSLNSAEITHFIVNATRSALVQGGGGAAPEGQDRVPGVMADPIVIDVEYRYTREDLRALFDAAYEEDVERGGRYDARSGAIHVHTHPWSNETMRAESTIMGTFYAVWGQGNSIWQIELEDGFALEDLLEELGALEEKAIGRRVYGR
jgi:hypothetical protein